MNESKRCVSQKFVSDSLGRSPKRNLEGSKLNSQGTSNRREKLELSEPIGADPICQKDNPALHVAAGGGGAPKRWGELIIGAPGASLASLLERREAKVWKERTMETDDEILDAIENWGLFRAKLNNGTWAVGKATYIYHIDITQDHCADPNLSISPSLAEAVAKAVEKLKGATDDGTREG